MTTARFTIARGVLLPALTAVNRAVEKRNTIPILGNVLLRAEGGTLFVTGTNLDVEVKAPAKEIGVPDFEPFTVPSGMLHDAVGKMAESAEIAFEGDGNFVNVKSGRTRFRLQFLPATDFPVLPADSFTHSFSLPAKVLAHIVATVSFAISTEETRYYLNGIHLHHDGTYLAAVATDGHRLALVTLDPPAGSKDMPGIIVPRSTVSLISHFVKGDGDIGIELSSQKIRFTLSDGTTITSKLIDGTFPDYRRVIPSSNDKTYVLDRAALAAAIDRVSTVSTERGRAVRFTFSESEVKLEVNNPDSGQAEDGLSVAEGHADTMEIGLNHRYCLDVLAACGGEKVRFELSDPGAPCRVVPADAAGSTEPPIFVIMPMRV